MGTFRKDRHAHLLAMPVPAAASPVPAGVRDGLQARGLAFVTATWAQYGGWSPVTEVLLREAGLLLDELETLRGTKDERPAQRMLIAMLQALGLKE
jgi:hypothetical protein